VGVRNAPSSHAVEEKRRLDLVGDARKQRALGRPANLRANEENGTLGGCEDRGCALETGGSSNNICSDRKFSDFKVDLEFNISPDGNSGVYLRGRHEIQIKDDYNVGHTTKGATGALCPFVSPSVFVSRPADQWQTVEATLIGNKVTVILNGTKIHDGIELNQVVSGVLDNNINAPGPILLQGNRGTVRFRNLMIKEIK